MHALKRFRITISSVECRAEWRTSEGEYDKGRNGDGTLGLNEISSSGSSEIAFQPIAPSFARLPEELDFNWAEGTDKKGSVYPDYRTYAFAVLLFFFFRIILENFSCIFSMERKRKRERKKEKKNEKKKAVKISETKEKEEEEKRRWKS